MTGRKQSNSSIVSWVQIADEQNRAQLFQCTLLIHKFYAQIWWDRYNLSHGDRLSAFWVIWLTWVSPTKHGNAVIKIQAHSPQLKRKQNKKSLLSPIVKKCLQLAKRCMIYAVVVQPTPNRVSYFWFSLLCCFVLEWKLSWSIHSLGNPVQSTSTEWVSESWVRRNELLFLQTQRAEWAAVSHCKLDTISSPTRAETWQMRNGSYLTLGKKSQCVADKSSTDINSICTKHAPTSTPTPTDQSS